MSWKGVRGDFEYVSLIFESDFGRTVERVEFRLCFLYGNGD